MTSLYIWHYFLSVPEEEVQAADLVSPYLGNPGGVKKTFRPHKKDVALDEEGLPIWEYDENGLITNATHWVASFLATELNSEGNPSKEMLEYYISETPELSGILWVRTKNPHHPDTVEAEKSKVVATNWDAFDVGDPVDLSTIMENL